MAETLLVVKVRGQRDVMRARQRARQICGLLGYDRGRQAVLAATVFLQAQQALSRGALVMLHFQVDQDQFRVEASLPEVPPSLTAPALGILPLSAPEPLLQLCQPLPKRDDALGAVDLAWIARQLQQHTPLNLFEEIQRQNQELLAVHLELQACRAQLSQLAQQPAA